MKLLEILRQSVPFVSKVFNEVQKSFSGSNYELQNWFYPGLFKMSSKGRGLDLMQECPNCGPGAICGLQMIFFFGNCPQVKNGDEFDEHNRKQLMTQKMRKCFVFF